MRSASASRALVPAHEERWYQVYGEVVTSGAPIHFEDHAAALGRWYEVYAYRVGDPAERQVGVLFADITRRKQAERELHDADRRKDEFLATLSHELRNPLAPLRSALDILQMTDDAAVVRQLVPLMSRQVDQMTRLVNDLIEISRITHGQVALQMEPLELAAVLADAVETSRPLLDAARQTLALELPDTPLPVRGDALRLAQVFTNLLNNAARHGRRGHGGGAVVLRAWRDRAHVLVSVRDDGDGIPPDQLQAIFGLFTQLGRDRDSAQPGLGIGLSLVRSLVHGHGGEVEARSAGLGQGAELVVRLPLAPDVADNP